MNHRLRSAAAAVLLPAGIAAQAQVAPPAAPASAPPIATLPTVTVRASADASAQGLSPAYPGGQVARGGRAGILGTQDNMETPFSITALHQRADPGPPGQAASAMCCRTTPASASPAASATSRSRTSSAASCSSSDDVAYNGLYSLLPRQYIATELFERVEVLRGASAFLIGANPGGGGIGGAINLLPKRATERAADAGDASASASGSQFSGAADIARRFGPDQSTGVRLNVAGRNGDTGIDDEKARTRPGLRSASTGAAATSAYRPTSATRTTSSSAPGPMSRWSVP